MNAQRKRLNSTSAHVRKLTYSALFIALSMALPFLTGQIPEVGSMLCPMHLPALLCGFICGWPWGLAVGVVSPLMRSVIFGMPPMMTAIPMAFELGVYGAAAGFLYRVLPKKPSYLYLSLITAMVCGRIVWGGVRFLMAGLQNTEFSFEIFLAGAVTSAIPGIILQILLVPIVVLALDRAGQVLNR